MYKTEVEMSKNKLLVLVSLYGWWVALALYVASQKDTYVSGKENENG